MSQHTELLSGSTGESHSVLGPVERELLIVKLCEEMKKCVCVKRDPEGHLSWSLREETQAP
jgi:hypothetical protein